ncbi:MAG: HTH domain-containing protein [Simkaniaceae bacterium]|nr:MAG: HTH domain-containing protein [Simkaniaceae bacterium]
MKHQKFWTQKLFEKQNEVQMSIQEIADFLGISRTSARNYIKRDLETKLIERWNQFVESKKTRLVCQGKNIYKLKGSA